MSKPSIKVVSPVISSNKSCRWYNRGCTARCCIYHRCNKRF